MRKRVGVEQKLSNIKTDPTVLPETSVDILYVGEGYVGSASSPVCSLCWVLCIVESSCTQCFSSVHCVECCVLWRVHLHNVSALLKRWCSSYGLKRTIGQKVFALNKDSYFQVQFRSPALEKVLTMPEVISGIPGMDSREVHRGTVFITSRSLWALVPNRLARSTYCRILVQPEASCIKGLVLPSRNSSIDKATRHHTIRQDHYY